MPHSVPVPSAGFQALILCGPGVSLNTFTSNPEEFPKALIPIANRPMVWYPLDWCYRMGVSSVTPASLSEENILGLSANYLHRYHFDHSSGEPGTARSGPLAKPALDLSPCSVSVHCSSKGAYYDDRDS